MSCKEIVNNKNPETIVTEITITTTDTAVSTVSTSVSDVTTTTTDTTQPATVKGDANEDGKLDVRDCAYIAGMLAKGMDEKLPECSDFNDDGKINVRDAAAIASFLASKME